MTPLVLRHDGDEIALNSLPQSLRAAASFDYFTWRFLSETESARVEGSISAAPGDFVGLAYQNPPGGVKHCLNTKIASCSLSLIHKAGRKRGAIEILSSSRRAAFEILTDDRGHGVAIRA